jgi:tyrosine-protein phosphatase YwqE
MFGGLFSRKKKEQGDELPVPERADWSVIGADMHSHFIPGIDDGAKTIDDSLNLLRAMGDMGYKTIITTPHIMIDYYPNTRQTILSGLETVRQAVKEHNIDIEVSAAAEYYIDDHFTKLLETEPLLTIQKNEVLVEFSMLYEPPMLAEVIFNIQKAGYRPIIAHPERYLFFHKNFDRYSELKDRGCMLQLNMLSITGYYGRNIKSIADALLKKGLYDYCGSDMHHERHAGVLRAMGMSKDYHVLANYPFLNKNLCMAGKPEAATSV